MSGGASVTISVTSTAMTQARLENGACAVNLRAAQRRIGRTRRRQVLLHQGDDQIGIIVEAKPLDRIARTEVACSVSAQYFVTALSDGKVHGLFYVVGDCRSRSYI